MDIQNWKYDFPITANKPPVKHYISNVNVFSKNFGMISASNKDDKLTSIARNKNYNTEFHSKPFLTIFLQKQRSQSEENLSSYSNIDYPNLYSKSYVKPSSKIIIETPAILPDKNEIIKTVSPNCEGNFFKNRLLKSTEDVRTDYENETVKIIRPNRELSVSLRRYSTNQLPEWYISPEIHLDKNGKTRIHVTKNCIPIKPSAAHGTSFVHRKYFSAPVENADYCQHVSPLVSENKSSRIVSKTSAFIGRRTNSNECFADSIYKIPQRHSQSFTIIPKRLTESNQLDELPTAESSCCRTLLLTKRKSISLDDLQSHKINSHSIEDAYPINLPAEMETGFYETLCLGGNQLHYNTPNEWCSSSDSLNESLSSTFDSDTEEFDEVLQSQTSIYSELERYDFSTLDSDYAAWNKISVIDVRDACAITSSSLFCQTHDDFIGAVNIFNSNKQGLHIKLQDDMTCADKDNLNNIYGNIRLFINLIKPIKIVRKSDKDRNDAKFFKCCNRKQVTTLLPRGVSKVFDFTGTTTVEDLIATFIKRYGIQEPRKKFALYEHTISKNGTTVHFRKWKKNETILINLLNLTKDGEKEFLIKLKEKRFVLQEDETLDINWKEFSIPELQGFLKILVREEDCYRQSIKLKYLSLKNTMESHLKLLKSKD